MVTPLVRTEGKTYQSGYSLDIDRLLREEPLRVEARDSIARAAETALSLPPSLYFYVGHACPAFGDLVFVYDLKTFDNASGSASDHDTGGLHAGYIHFSRPLTDQERCQWSAAPDHRWAIRDAAGHTTLFVKKYFQSFAAYCRGERAVNDDADGRLHHSRNERRAWTIEVRLEADQPLLAGVRLIGVSTSAYEAIRDAVTSDPNAYAGWSDLLDLKVVRPFDPSRLHSEIEALLANGEVP